MTPDLPSEFMGRTCDRFTPACRAEKTSGKTLAFNACPTDSRASNGSDGSDGGEGAEEGEEGEGGEAPPCTRFTVNKVMLRPATIRGKIQRITRGTIDDHFSHPVAAYLQYAGLPLKMAIAFGGGVPEADPANPIQRVYDTPLVPAPSFTQKLRLEATQLWLSSREAGEEADIGTPKARPSTVATPATATTPATAANIVPSTTSHAPSHATPGATPTPRGLNATTVAQLHYDDFESLSFQVQGWKEWLLYPPSEGPDLRQGYMLEGTYRAVPTSKMSKSLSIEPVPLGENRKVVVEYFTSPLDSKDHPLGPALRCMVGPGEAILVPAHWWHEVWSTPGGSFAVPTKSGRRSGEQQRSQPQPKRSLNLAFNFWFSPFFIQPSGCTSYSCSPRVPTSPGARPGPPPPDRGRSDTPQGGGAGDGRARGAGRRNRRNYVAYPELLSAEAEVGVEAIDGAPEA